ncbi:hypothetical protein [Paenibacillus donghaensis]|uniref:hypothetical protein n=1 Tax=Paenibacillus donghaensis TaxID=414771 RepID=UPI0012FE4938|nr:hypothetical protein [Paenibacillus donghaensis]
MNIDNEIGFDSDKCVSCGEEVFESETLSRCLKCGKATYREVSGKEYYKNKYY